MGTFTLVSGLFRGFLIDSLKVSLNASIELNTASIFRISFSEVQIGHMASHFLRNNHENMFFIVTLHQFDSNL
jgi:hypothetical protein